MKKYALMLLFLAITSCTAENKQETQEVAKAVKSIKLDNANSELKLTFPGKVIAGKEADITFKVSGKLNKLPVKEGQKINKGDIIAQLDQKDYKFAYQKQLATFNENKASYARAKELIKNKYISQADFDKKKKSFEVAQADLSIAKTNLDYTTLRAPFSGEVAKVYADNFQNIQVKENIAKLQNLNFLEVKISVPERVIINSKSPEGVKILARFDANSTNAYAAEITEISTQADASTQTYEATVRLPRPTDINVLPGMTAIIEAYSKKEATAPDSFSIPADSIFSDSSKNTYVWIINTNNRLEKRNVKVKSFEGNDVEVTKGLSSGDTLVTAGVNFLKEEQLVTVYDKKQK
ncbi:MAG: Efflux pump periplasmic linker BepF [Proteobacteria bacterium]|nr:MAG: Efflux pump periplasmic linker BepF [Pseudomonadota bacterium]|tara:strand:+ start:85 stop:1137 length:1053 start_codon:yes stop_codon:yes gene_type:complete